jgi:hypothetical protein
MRGELTFAESSNIEWLVMTKEVTRSVEPNDSAQS